MKRLTDIELIEELQKRFSENQKALEELRETTEQLKVLNKKLEDSEALKSHFLSNIRNEIINPFASIIGLASFISNMKNPDLEKIQNMAYLIYTEAFQLDFQLKNIFAAAEIEAGEAQPQTTRVSVSGVINSCIDAFKHITEPKFITVNFDNKIDYSQSASPHFATDSGKLEMIISNILSNAIQFSHEGGKIYIVASAIENELIVSIQDFGIGMNENDKQLIFDRFKRVNNAINTPNKGHGLGLSVCADYLAILSGEISFQSEENKGSTFTVRIPAFEGQNSIEGHSAEGNELMFDDGELF